MKIAVFTDTYFPQINGVVSYLSNSLPHLSKDNQVVLFAPGNEKFRTENVSENLAIHWIPASPFPFYEGYRISSMNYERVSSLLKKEKPDIVHAHAPVVLGLQGLISAKRLKIPVLVTYHTHFPDYLPHLLKGKLPAQFSMVGDYTVKKLIKHVFKFADAVTAPTHELVKELESYGLAKVHYLPNGVELGRFARDQAKGKAFREKHGIAETSKVIVYLGRVSFEKRIAVLLEAFKMIEKEDRVLVIAGGGPSLEDLKRLSKGLELKNVVFTGYTEDPAEVYSAGDLFASPSDSETFGLTFIEAMHCRLPVIGVNRFGPKELIKDGKNGLLVEPGDVMGLAKAMEKLLEDDQARKAMAAEGYESSKGYSLESSVEKTIGLYKQLRRAGPST